MCPQLMGVTIDQQPLRYAPFGQSYLNKTNFPFEALDVILNLFSLCCDGALAKQ